MTALIGAEVHHGLGGYDRHVSADTKAKLIVVSNNFWVLIVNITKGSILVQYLRVFSDRKVRMSCYTLLVLVLPAAFWGVFGGTFACSPTAKLWKPELPGHCMSARTYWISVAGLDIGLDFLLLLLPLPAIGSLRLPRKQKFGLMLAFLLGFFVCIVSVARLATVQVISAEGHEIQSGLWAIILSAFEANVGIVCACLLSLKPLAAKIFPGMMEETLPAKHSMQLPTVVEICPLAESSEAMLAQQRSASIPTTPTTMKSKTSGSLRSLNVNRTQPNRGICGAPYLSAADEYV